MGTFRTWSLSLHQVGIKLSAILLGKPAALEADMAMGPDKQLNSYLSRRRVLLLAGVLGKSSHPQLMSFYQSMLFLPRLALTCALWSTGKPQCGTSPSLLAQENPISLDGAWNLMRVLHLQFHSQAACQEHSRAKKNPIEKYWVVSRGEGGS